MSSGRPSLRRFPRKFVRWVADHWDKSPWLFNGAGAALAMLVGGATVIDQIPGYNFVTVIWAAVAIIAVVLLVAGPYFLAKRAERVKNLLVRIERLEHQKQRIDSARVRDSAELKSVLDGAGRELLRECGLDSEDTRISIYQHHGSEKKFALVGRVSRNPTLCQQGRSAYQDDVGLIAKAWQEETAYDRVWFTDPGKWVDYQVRTHGLNRETASGIRMKSLSYLGVRIDDGDHPVGILVVESKDRDRVTVEHAETVRSHDAFLKMQIMLHAAPKLPLEDPSLAAADQGSPGQTP